MTACQSSIQNKICNQILRKLCAFMVIIPLLFVLLSDPRIQAQSLDIPSSEFGISIGNSKNFTGLRLNFRDRHVQEVNGINVTIWRASENEMAEVNGLSLGLMPEAGSLTGIQAGILGVSAAKELSGINFGLLGAGAGGDISGFTFGGLGAGSGGSIKGIVFGGLGAGCGGDMTGIAIGGLGVGCGGDMTGLTIGGLGTGCSGNLKGISFGVLGAGCAGDATGIMIGGLGTGCAGDMTGFAFGLAGAGCGGEMTGIFAGGIGVGCGIKSKGIILGGVGAGAPEITGLVFGGAVIEAEKIKGATVSLGRMKIKNEGSFTGLGLASWNHVTGQQTGITLGIFNYASRLKGLQIGLLNYVRENPPHLRILPIINF